MIRPSYLAVSTCFLFIILLSTQCKSKSSDETPPILEETEVMNLPEVNPRFPGCEEISDLNERKNCADKKLLEYVYQKIQYPPYALENNVQGRCVISFIIETDGKVSHAKIVKDIGGGCGEVSLQVVNSMNEMKDPWIPGMNKGKLIRTQYHLPVNFKLKEKGEK
ncbi:MAG: energy transducer TonB [Saprospiraceae bacterium]